MDALVGSFVVHLERRACSRATKANYRSVLGGLARQIAPRGLAQATVEDLRAIEMPAAQARSCRLMPCCWRRRRTSGPGCLILMK
jgi:anti-sigma factor ChrR (cupin superfamily)